MKWLVRATIILLSAEAHVDAFVGSLPSQQHRQINNKNDANTCTFPTAIIGGQDVKAGHHQLNSSTALPMGIRSILGLGKGSKDDKEKSENPEDIKAALEAIKADLEAVTAEEKRAAKAKANPKSKVKSKTEQSKKKKINLKPETKPKIKIPERKKKTVARSVPSEPTSATTYGETVRDRINRVKSGHMTDEEKAAFLNSALTRTPPGSNGPPIRQEIPAANGSSRGASSSSASPFPKDALWNTLSNGQSSSSSSSSSSGNTGRYGNTNLTGDSDSAKREYLDMVTNPDRFKSYAAMGGYRSSEKSPQASKPSSKGDVVENLNMLDTPSVDDTEADLASRLESAAILKEQQDAEAKARKEEEERSLEAKLQEEQKRRSEEIRRLEEERLAAKRAEEEAKLKAEQDAKDAEVERIADMQAAQDSYWAKKLEEENARRDRSMDPKDKISLGEKMRSDAEARLAKAAMEAARKAEVGRMREEERKREDPHESEILKEAAEDELHQREINAEITEKSSAYVSNTVPQNRDVDVSSNAFVEQQEKKKAALDAFMKEQKDRLASLNSPLPFLPNNPKVQSTPKQTDTKSKPPAVIPSLNLADLTMKKSKSPTDSPKPVPSPSPAPVPRLNLADLTMAKKPTAPSPAPVDSSPPRLNLADLTMAKKPADPPSEDTTPRLSLAEMTMLKKPQTGGTPPSTPNRRKSPASASSGSKPIRQSIPISNDEDEDEDFFEYSRGGDNSGMSIKDIMASKKGSVSSGNKKTEAAKAQSKMWGIDIDRFTD